LDHVTFERNEDYWGEKPITKTQTWRIIPESNTRTIMLQNGQTDAIFTSLSEGDIELFMAEPEKFSIVQPLPDAMPNAILFNMPDPILSDYNFRRACVHAIDREEVALIAQGPYGYSPETEGTMWGYYMPYRNHNIPFIEYNPEKAKEYLAKTSYNGEEITIMTAAFSVNYIQAAEVIQEQLSRVGIKINIFQTDNAGLQAACQPDVRSKNQMIVWCQTLANHCTNDYKNSFQTGAVRNRQSFSDAELDALIIKDAATEDGPEKEAIAMRMQEIVGESLCTVNLFWSRPTQASVKGLGGIRFIPSATDYRYIYKVVK
jgi:peptide/nickel transport system substrate-binding protein